MKAALLGLLGTFVCFSISAHASAPPELLAVAATAGGMPGPNGSQTYELQIMSNGKVFETTNNKNSRLVATLPPAAIQRIKGYEAKLNVRSGLVPVNPNSPKCEDGSTATLWAKGSDGKTMEVVGGISECREMVPSVDSDEASVLRSVLKDLDGLSNL